MPNKGFNLLEIFHEKIFPLLPVLSCLSFSVTISFREALEIFSPNGPYIPSTSILFFASHSPSDSNRFTRFHHCCLSPHFSQHYSWLDYSLCCTLQIVYVCTCIYMYVWCWVAKETLQKGWRYPGYFIDFGYCYADFFSHHGTPPVTTTTHQHLNSVLPKAATAILDITTKCSTTK